MRGFELPAIARGVLVALPWLAGVGLPAKAYAWGDTAHQIVCKIAYDLTSEEGRALVDEIRTEGGPPAAATFHESCTWPDEVRNGPFRGTRTEHFLVVAAGAPNVDLARDCASLDCVTSAIQRYGAIVARDPEDSSRDRIARAAALRFLGHFVGDLHQPLHVAHYGDWGGNRTPVTWFGSARFEGRPMQLHRVWDDEILNQAGYTSVAAGGRLAARIAESEAASWRSFDLVAWTDESYHLANSHAYRRADGSRVKPGDALGQDYFEWTRPVAETQVMKAAVRLAHLLDAAATGALPRNMLTLEPATAGTADGPDGPGD
jgi:hypothetical protein